MSLLISTSSSNGVQFSHEKEQSQTIKWFLCAFEALSAQTGIFYRLNITRATRFQNLYLKEDFVNVVFVCVCLHVRVFCLFVCFGPPLYLLPKEYGLLSKLENY